MALAGDVGNQPDWHGQDCFMGIGELLHSHPSHLQAHAQELNLKRNIIAQTRLVEALFWVPWCMGVLTAPSA